MVLFTCGAFWTPATLFTVTKGKIAFTSDAPLELIQASSEELKGLIDLDKNSFAFTVKTQSFVGFNSSLQREHFNENYMESHKFPACTFSGKIIEDFDLAKDGTYIIRAKGNLSVHGITKERIIKSEVESKDGKLIVKSFFTVSLHEHNIAIPKIVHQKIAEEIQVTIQADFSKK